MSDELSARLEKYLAKKLDAPALRVTDLARIPGGASRETYRFRAHYKAGKGEVERALILRRDPPASLIETDRTTEYRAYEAFHRVGLPVPEPIALELDPAALDRPFFVMEEITGCEVASILNPDPYATNREKIGKQFWNVLGRIASANPDQVGLGSIEGTRDVNETWRHEVARWEKVIDDDEREPQPIARAAIRWLKRNPPPAAQKIAVVHGDYRTGNFLFDAKGDIRAILDWEMAHLGDPLEDLAWALDPLWAHGDVARPAGLLARADAIRIWEEASGLKADPAALAWWEVFASLKGLAIWISAACEYAEGRNTDAVNAFSGWFCLAFHNKVLAERLGA
ncbi:MAG TPA: phosphotransferase family protein [Rhizomicrobium sp.]|nr:phosphotransferase family protein [Rhizomicrobium sp.]